MVTNGYNPGMSEKKADEAVTIRFPLEVYAELKALAAREERSFNRQVILALREWLQQRATPESAPQREDDQHP